MMKTLFLLTAIALLVSISAASTDPFVGKWVLDVQRSKYPKGTCPKRMVIEMKTVGPWIRYQSDATYANGATAHAEYTAEYNGKQSIVMGARGMLLPVFLRRINSYTVVASYTKALQVVATSRRTVSPDGRWMTITTTSTTGAGKKLITVGIYEREVKPPTSSMAKAVSKN